MKLLKASGSDGQVQECSVQLRSCTNHRAEKVSIVAQRTCWTPPEGLHLMYGPARAWLPEEYIE